MKSSLAPDRRSPDKSQQESKGPVDQGQAVEMQSVNQIRPSIATEFLCCYHHSCVPSTKFYRIFVFFKHLLIYLSLHLYLSIYLSHSTFICMILFFFYSFCYTNVPLITSCVVRAVRTGEKKEVVAVWSTVAARQAREQLLQAWQCMWSCWASTFASITTVSWTSQQ